MNGLAFDLSSPHGRMMAIIIAGIADDVETAVMRSGAAGRQAVPASE
jgi:hypothetical protein